MSWFADLAGKAESLLNNLDEQTGVALQNHNVIKQKKYEKHDSVLHPEPSLGQKKRPIPRSLKKITSVNDTKSFYTPSRKGSPTTNQHSRPQTKEETRDKPLKTKKMPLRKPGPNYSLNHCPKTLVGDIKGSDTIHDEFGLKQRRFSLPTDLELTCNEDWTYRIQNLEVENAMLKNELNVMNREVSDLLDRLRKTEDGNDVVNNNNRELSRTQIKLESSELQTQRASLDKETLSCQFEKLKSKIQELTDVEVNTYKEKNQSLETEISILRDSNKELEIIVKELREKANEKDSSQINLEKELRHAQSTISDLQSNLEKTMSECHRLEKDWEAYKLRVKSMLFAKDSEIKALQEGLHLTEDTKDLMEQIDSLKVERDELSEAIARVRGECSNLKQYLEQVESRNNSTEQVVAALREALRDERTVRNRAEAQCIAMGKDLKTIQIETGQTIASLRTALRDKEHELNRLRESSSSVRIGDTSALNVADYDVMQEAIDNEKIQCLTQTLIQKQGKIDALLADNNILRIQLEKLESKFKAEVSSQRTNSHSVVQLQDGDYRTRSRNTHVTDSVLSTLSLRLGVMLKRYPIFRLFLIIYMIGLHFWVLTVLLTSTPEDFAIRPTKS